MSPPRFLVLWLATLVGALVFGMVAVAKDFEEVRLWTYDGEDGRVYGDKSYFPRGKSWARGILSAPMLHRSDVEIFHMTGHYSLLRVKETDRCFIVHHWQTHGEDDASGVYAIEFGKGGERFVTKAGERAAAAPFGLRHIGHFPDQATLSLHLESEPTLEEREAIESLTKLENIHWSGPGVTDKLLGHLRCKPWSVSLARSAITAAGLKFALAPELASLTLENNPSLSLEPAEVALMPHLEQLRLANTRISKDSLVLLRDTPSFTRLELHQVTIDETWIPLFAESGIKALALVDVPLSNAAIQRLMETKPAWMGVATRKAVHSWDIVPATPDREKLRAACGTFLMRGGDILDVKIRDGANNLVIERITASDQLASDGKVGRIDARKGVASDGDLAAVGVLIAGTNPLGDTIVDMENVAITGRGFRDWTKGPRELNLTGSRLDDQGARQLGRVASGKLRLDRTPITDKGMEWIVVGGAITLLSLNDTAVTDQSVKFIARRNRTSLRDLSLDGTKITPACVEDLSRLKGLAKLSARRTALTNDDKTRLKQALPQCEIQFSE